jgi:membrane protease YdiL (CAAX protease family)
VVSSEHGSISGASVAISVRCRMARQDSRIPTNFAPRWTNESVSLGPGGGRGRGRRCCFGRSPCAVHAVAMTGLVAAVVEEAAYRGYLQSCLERLWGPRLAIVMIAAVFTLAHLPAAWSYPVVLISIFVAGILFGSAAAIFGSILSCVLLHAFVDWLDLPIEWGLIGRRWLAPLEVAGLDKYAMGLFVVAIVSGAATVWTLARVGRRTSEAC